MSQFLELNLEEYSLEEDFIRILPEHTSCICCLSQDAPLVDLKKCKHTDFLECNFKFKMILPITMVCLRCHNMLIKIELFKQQIEKSCLLFNDQTTEHKACSLRQSKVLHTNILPESDDDLQLSTESFVIKHESESVNVYDLMTEVKVEQDYSDMETDIPLSITKKQRPDSPGPGEKEKKQAKKKKNHKPEQSKSKLQMVQNKYAGKIKVLTLTKEILMSERELMAKEDKYLKLPYKCELCIVGFDFEMALKGHMEKQHSEKKNGHICDICQSVLSSIASLKEHSKRHLKRFECVPCGKRYHDEYSAVHHYNDAHGLTDAILLNFQCTDCDFVANSHRSYRYHRSKHKKDKQACTICGNLFVNTSSLKVHMYTMHKQSSRVYKCEPCAKVYKGKSGFFAHMSNAHGAGAHAYCAACRTHFRTARNLQHHLRTHSAHVSDHDKFICDECGTRFLSKASLKSHIEWEHLEMRNRLCNVCNKVFRTDASLKKHVEYVHEKKRPPRSKICDYCGRGFTTLAILRSHIRTHTGERPHRCAHCSAAFGHASALYNHNKLLHHPDRVHNK